MERRFVALVFCLGLLFILLFPPLDPDLGWHLRCGQDFWQKHQLCNTNQYAVLLPGYQWPAHYWLFQALLYPIYNFLGTWGLTIAAGAILTVALYLFFLTQPALIAPITTLILYLLSYPVFSLGIRSQLVGFLLFSCLLYLYKDKTSVKKHWIGLLIVWIWAQLHGSFIIGVLFLLSKFASDLLDRHLTKATPLPSTHVSETRFQQGVCLKKLIQKNTFLLPLFLLFPLTLLNPNGIHVYQEAWRHFSTVKLNLLIAEWVPPSWPYMVAVMLLLVINSVSIIKKISPALIPVFVFNLAVAYLGLKARRFIPFSAITLLFWSININPNYFSLKAIIARFPQLRVITFVVSFIPLTVGLIYQLPKTVTQNQNMTDQCLKQNPDSPCGAITYLKSQPDRLPVFNRYEWGGLLDWQLPEYRIFVDGRMPAWTTPDGKSPYTIYLETLQTQPGWEKTLETYNIGWLLISPGTFMDLLLRPNPNKYHYEESYRDQVSVIYRRQYD